MSTRIHPYMATEYHDYSVANIPWHDVTNTLKYKKIEREQTERFPSLSAAVRYPYSPCWPAPYPDGFLPGVT